MGIADFDGDGKGDVVWRHKSSQSFAVWYMDGVAIKSSRTFSGIGDAWDIRGTGDFNGDGKAEILWRNTTDNRVSMGTVTATEYGFTDMTYKGAKVFVTQDFTVEAIADFGGDGRSDILWRNKAGNIAVWEMNGAAIANPNMVKDPKTGADIAISVDEWGIVGAEYLGNDNRADILWRNKWDGKWAVWQMNRAVLETGGFLKEVATWQDLSKTPAGMAGRPAAIDEAGNTTATAFNVGVLTTQASFQGAVDAWDRADVYRFDVSGTQMLSVKLDGEMRSTNQDVNLALLGSNGAMLKESKNVGAQVDLIQASLEAGTYYVQVSPAGATDFNSYRLSLGVVPLTASLGFSTAIDDTGISQTDGITKNNRPMVEGTGPAGSVLRLYGQALGGSTVQPEVLLGSVTVGSNGIWKIQSPELADGDYVLSAKMVLAEGKEQKISQDWAVKIDTLRPKLTIDGIYDGVAYEKTENFTGTVSDADTGVTVKLNSTNLAIVNGQIGDTVTLTGKALEEQMLTFTAIDRAGNSQELNYQAMLLELDSLMEDDFILPNAPIELDDRTVPPNTGGTYVPTDTSGGQIYIGQGGAWGYSGSGGGTGGSAGWQPSNVGTGTPGSDPLIPVSDPALNQMLAYLPALRTILTTARDVLSKHSKTAPKKEALRQELEMLMEVGKLVEQGNLYSAMTPMLHGAFSNVGGMTRRAAILKGWDLAKNLAKETLRTKVQIAHANLFGVSLSVMKEKGAVDETQLRTVTESLVKTYAKLNPTSFSTYSTESAGGWSGHNFLDSIWRMGAQALGARQYAPLDKGETKVIQFAITDMRAYLAGQVNSLDALQMSDRMIQAATRVNQLNRDGYDAFNYVDGAFKVPSSIRSADFLDQIMNLNFSVMRLNPTVASNNLPTKLVPAEWLETIVKGKKEEMWTAAHIQSAAAGLGEWFDGFSVRKNPGGEYSRMRYNEMRPALDYVDRLVQSVGLVDDAAFVAEVRGAGFLSQMLNLGGSYAALNPTQAESPTAGFLHTMWTTPNQNSNWNLAAKQITQYIKPVSDSKKTLADAKWRLSSLKAADTDVLSANRNSPAGLAEIVDSARYGQEFSSKLAYGGGSKAPGKDDKLAVITIEKFVELVEAVEKVYKNDSKQQILTRIRNLYYSSPDFQALLPTAPFLERDPIVPIKYNMRTVRQESEEGTRSAIDNLLYPGVEKAVFQYLSARANENSEIDANIPKGDNPSPYIELANGDKIDVGHLLLTVDALQNPTSPIFNAIGIAAIEPASWIADLSIGDIWASYYKTTGKSINDKAPKPRQGLTIPDELDFYFEASASKQDLLGDIDGFGLNLVFRNELSLSSALRRYYINNVQDQYPGVSSRWFSFLQYHGGNAFDGTDTKIDFGDYQPKVGGLKFKFFRREVIIDQIVARMTIFDNAFYTKELKPESGSEFIENIKNLQNPLRYDSRFSREMAAKFVDYVISQTKRESPQVFEVIEEDFII
ncbi:MAG: VCBS repeat-containing protein [Alkalinema sp. RU_4_3]|nr:VCBS repeat-containing protein [Alkalinema sp. RU_4_3]